MQREGRVRNSFAQHTESGGDDDSNNNYEVERKNNLTKREERKGETFIW
jgi:hypothetical protein